MPVLLSAILLLINVIFNTYIFILLLRILFQKCHIDFYNPLYQWVLRMTNPPLNPLRRYMPHYAGFDSSALIFLFLLQCVKFILICLIESGLWPHSLGLIITAFADSVGQFLNLLFYALLFMVVISWVNPLNPLSGLINRITDPLLKSMKRYIPLIGGMDFTPMIAILGLKLIEMVLVTPLLNFGKVLM
ncbi:MAG: hypothetical protein LEGION0398_MBIBDBAK_00956 [Legionellaceae bacterium]